MTGVLGHRFKNRARQLCTGDWCILLDCDEFIPEWEFERRFVQSKCGWSPFEGEIFQGRPVMTILRGQIAMRDGEAVGSPVNQCL